MITVKLLGANPDGTDKVRTLNLRHHPETVAEYVYGTPAPGSVSVNFETHIYTPAHVDLISGLWAYELTEVC